MRLETMGDQGILARFADENGAVTWASAVRSAALPWVFDVVGAYSTVAVFPDLAKISLEEARAALAGIRAGRGDRQAGKLHLIPCCYDRGLDQDRVAKHLGLSADEIVRLHASREYTVYAIGFCPGFPYLGYLPEPLCGVPRLESPRVRVEAGMVGLTGRQTGIYTEPRPGGWNLVGQTPLTLVDVADGYFPLRTGDRVRFEPISPSEFDRLRGQRL